MEKFCIESCGAKCIIDTDVPLLDFFEENKEKILFPNLKILNYDSNVKYCLVYRNCNFGEEYFQCEEDLIIVKYPKEKLTQSNIAYIARYLIEKQFASMGMATCHSACVAKNNQAILLLGGAGAGKTSVAINLCAHYGYSLISNDQTTIGIKNNDLYAFGGSHFINLRYSSVKENMPYLEYIFDDKKIDEWNDKKLVTASEIGLLTQYEECPIKKIMFLHVDNRSDTIMIKSGDSWRNNFILYQILTENIRNSLSTIVDKNGYPISYVPSYDTEEYFNYRKDIMTFINSNPNYKTVIGPLSAILGYINQDSNKIENELVKEKKYGRYQI